MKRFVVALLVCVLTLGMGELQAQTKKPATNTSSTSKAKSSKTTTTSKNKKTTKTQKAEPEEPQIEEVALPFNSNDCLFAVELKPNVPYGPTTAPNGAGRMMEIMADKNHPCLFEHEHNSVWYKFRAPYSGDLVIDIMQTNPDDDYDFLVYKYTNDYFSNQIIQNKISPVASNLSSVDTVKLAAMKSNSKNKKHYSRKDLERPMIGMHLDAKSKMLTKKSTEGFIKSIPVRKDEVYYIVLDNLSQKGSGHTIKVNVHVESFSPLIVFYDPVAKKAVDVDLLILEKNTNNREIVKNPKFKSGRIEFVPNFSYTLYAKKDGYFSIYKDFNANIFMEDTAMRFIMNRTEKGTVFPITDLYFDSGESELLPESDTTLLNYVSMFRNHPDVTFEVKGYVATYGLDVEYDQRVSLERAESVKAFFVSNGIAASRITVSGMTPSEIKRAATAAFSNKGNSQQDTKVSLIITGMNGK